MADSTSDSGSVQSLQVEQGTEKKSDVLSRFYALYSFYPHRLQTRDGTIVREAHEEGDGSLSLSVVATNLAATTETDLRKMLAHKLSKHTYKIEEGAFVSVGLNSAGEASSSASCYYSVIETTSESLGFDLVNVDGKPDSLNDCQQFVVCFISFQESSLDMFKTELDQYSQLIISLLDKEPLVPSHSLPGSTNTSNNASSLVPDPLTEQKELSQLSTKIHIYLEQWPYNVLEYLARTLRYMGPNIQYLIYAALLNATLQISGATAEQEEDVKRFFQCCSLSSLLEKLQTDATSVIGSKASTDLWQPVTISIMFEPDGKGVTFDKAFTCHFSKNAGEKFMSLDISNMTRIKDFLDSIKLGFTHSLNKLKRFLKQAELDHYELYRAFSYLKNCGCGDLLLRYVKLDDEPEILNVLTVLETFIKEMKQTLM